MGYAIGLNAQIDSATLEKVQKLELSADAETKYYDEENKEITQVEFRKAQETGKFSVKPVITEKMKLISLRLVSTKPTLPDFSEAKPFISKTLKGENVSLAQLKGKVVVLNFWFVGCAPCVKEMPDLNTLVDKFKDNPNVVFLAPTFDNLLKVNDFLKKKAFNYTIIPDARGWINDYAISTYPTHVIIDRRGTIAFSQINEGEKVIALMEKTINELLVKDVKRLISVNELPQNKNSVASVDSSGDEPIDGMFMMTNKTVIQDENGKKMDNRAAAELLNTEEYLPYRRKTNEGEIIIIKKKKG
jgi:peroxiredoxin